MCPFQAAIMPARAGTPDNGLVSRGVDAVAVCPISGGYRTFASSQAPGKVDRFLPATWHLSRPPTRATSPSFAGGVLPDTERASAR